MRFDVVGVPIPIVALSILRVSWLFLTAFLQCRAIMEPAQAWDSA